jgi:hypothetical protein
MSRKFLAIGPTAPLAPCDPKFPHPKMGEWGGDRQWHLEESARLIDRWFIENPEATLVDAKTRNNPDPKFIDLFVDITYEASDEGHLAIERRKEDRENRIRERRERRWAEYEEQRQRVDKIKSSRRVAKLCVMCGKPLPLLARLFGSGNHKECESFTE